jgi:hypothetical protein
MAAKLQATGSLWSPLHARTSHDRGAAQLPPPLSLCGTGNMRIGVPGVQHHAMRVVVALQSMMVCTATRL